MIKSSLVLLTLFSIPSWAADTCDFQIAKVRNEYNSCTITINGKASVKTPSEISEDNCRRACDSYPLDKCRAPGGLIRLELGQFGENPFGSALTPNDGMQCVDCITMTADEFRIGPDTYSQISFEPKSSGWNLYEGYKPSKASYVKNSQGREMAYIDIKKDKVYLRPVKKINGTVETIWDDAEAMVVSTALENSPRGKGKHRRMIMTYKGKTFISEAPKGEKHDSFSTNYRKLPLDLTAGDTFVSNCFYRNPEAYSSSSTPRLKTLFGGKGRNQ